MRSSTLNLIIAIGVIFVGILILTACDLPPSQPSAFQAEKQTEESTQKRLMTATPAPVMTRSAERLNLKARLERLNSENMSGCIYLFHGPVYLGMHTVKGKVSSLNSYLTGKDKIINDPNAFGEGHQSLVVEAPDLDGTYGENDGGIFFFDGESGDYIEHKGEYTFSQQCAKVTVSPFFVSTTR